MIRSDSNPCPDQVAIEPLKLAVVGDGLASAQPFAQRRLDAARSSSIVPKTSSTARLAVALSMPARSICIRTRTLPRRRMPVSVRAIASATRASSIARSSRRRATASSIASASWPLRASRCADLRLRQLAPREHLQAVDVRVDTRSRQSAASCARLVRSTLSAAESRDFRRTDHGLGHLVAAHVGRSSRCPAPSA